MNWILIWLHKLPFSDTTEDDQLTWSDAELISPKGIIDGQWKHA